MTKTVQINMEGIFDTVQTTETLLDQKTSTETLEGLNPTPHPQTTQEAKAVPTTDGISKELKRADRHNPRFQKFNLYRASSLRTPNLQAKYFRS